MAACLYKEREDGRLGYQIITESSRLIGMDLVAFKVARAGYGEDRSRRAASVDMDNREFISHSSCKHLMVPPK